MTANKETKVWWKKILDVVLDEVGAKLNEQNVRIGAVEAKMAQFEYKGTWQAGTIYRQHNFSTQDGSLWVCTADQSMQRPGDGSDWRLCVKRGKDGRDARP